MKRNWLTGIFAVASFLMLALYGAAPLFLPKPQPASIPSDRFSSERAMQHVDALAQSPRVAGTEGMERATAYIVAALRTCGLSPEIQQAPSDKGTLRNVIARIPGSQPGNAILIVSHVDSVSYGAGDNASGAAVLLETACAVNPSAPLRNDIILLFEDGEEYGYLGGYAFAKTDASISTIHRVIGLDTAAWGPVVLIQTTPDNTDFIRAYAGAVKRPTAFGFFADADWTISNDSSEIQPFYEHGIPGLELEDPNAFTGKHFEADTAENVQPGSVQQMGDQVLALARMLGDSDLSRTEDSRRSYFTLLGWGIVHYPANWNIAFAILSAIGLVALTVQGIRFKVQTGRGLLLTTVFLFLTTIGAAVCGVIGSIVFSKLFPNPNPKTGSYLVPASLPFFMTVIVLVMIAYLVFRGKLVKRFGSSAVTLAGLFFWLVIAAVTALLMPVGSYIFTVPLLAAVLAAFLPGQWKFARIIPAAMATILIAPNMVLAFLGTGMETLVLVVLLMVMNVDLWANLS